MDSFLRKFVETQTPFLIAVPRDDSPKQVKVLRGKESHSAFASIGDLERLERTYLASKRAVHERVEDAGQFQLTDISSLITSSYKKRISISESNAKKFFNQLLETHSPSPLFEKVFSQGSPLEKTCEELGLVNQTLLFLPEKLYSCFAVPSTIPENISTTFGYTKRTNSPQDFVLAHERILNTLFPENNKVKDLSPKHEQSSIVIKSLEKNLYTVQMSSPDYIIKKDSFCYLFTGFQSEFSFFYSGKTGKLLSYPVVRFPKKYEHPFVFSGGKICFDNGNRWKRKGISLNKRSLASTKDFLSFTADISYVASEAVRTLKEGYRERVTPVNMIEDFLENKVSEKYIVERGVFVYDNT